MALQSLEEYQKNKKKKQEEQSKIKPTNLLSLEDYQKQNGKKVVNRSVEDFETNIKAQKELQNSASKQIFDWITEETPKTKQDSGLINKNTEGNIFEKILGTAGDLTSDFAKGFVKGSISLGNLASFGVAQVADWTGHKDYANNVREANNLLLNTPDKILKPIDSTLEKYSYSGELLDSVFQSIGQSYANAKFGDAVGKITNLQGLNKTVQVGKLKIDVPLTSVISGMSNSMNEAYQNGATNTQAFVSGIIGGVSEGISEGFFGGAFGQGGSSIDDIANKWINNIASNTARRFLKTGVQALGEGAEEVISYALEYALGGVANGMYAIAEDVSGKDLRNGYEFQKDWDWKEVGQSFFAGALSGGISTGAKYMGMSMGLTQNQRINSAIESKTSEVQRLNGETLSDTQKSQIEGIVKNNPNISAQDIKTELDSNQKIKDVLIQEEQQKLKEQKAKEMGDDILPEDVPLSDKEKATIEKQVDKNIEEGKYSTSKIESILSSEEDTKKFSELKTEVDNRNAKLNEIQTKIDNETDASKKQALQNQYDRLQNDLNAFRETNKEFITNHIKNTKYIENNRYNPYYNSYVKEYNKSIEYQTKETGNEKVDNWQKSLVNVNVNNSEKAHKLNDFVSKLINDKGIKVEAINYDTLVEEGKMRKRVVDGKTIYEMEVKPGEFREVSVNGYTENGVLKLNVQGDRAFETTIGHEIGEFIKANEPAMYDELVKLATDLGSEDGTFNPETLKQMAETYGDQTDSVIDEYVNDKLGELFTNEEFVNRLGTKPNLLQKIIGEVKHLVNLVTTKSSEGKKLLRLQHKLENKLQEVYRKSDFKDYVKYELNKTLSEQQQEILNKINELRQQYNEVSNTITQQEQTNSLVDAPSNTLNNVNNESEQPKTYYHGTRGEFETFDNSKIGQNYEDSWSSLGKGFYFTDSYDNAKEFGEASINDGKVTVKEATLDIKKPLFADDLAKSDKETLNKLMVDYNLDSKDIDNGYNLIDALKREGHDSTEVLKQYGYDGIIADDEVMVFDANQIKLKKTNGKDNAQVNNNDDINLSLSNKNDIAPYNPNLTYSEDVKIKPNTSLQELNDFFNQQNKVEETKVEKKEIPKNPTKEESYDKPKTRHEVIQEYRQEARDSLGNLSEFKDKKRGIQYQINTMKRNLRDIVNKETATKLYEKYFQPITQNNATIEKEITKYNEKISQYNLNKEESSYVQMYGEKKYNPDTTITDEQILEFYKQNQSKINQQKCIEAVETFRNVYDDLISQMNVVLEANGYDPIPYREGYFPHFIEDKPNTLFGKIMSKFGWNVKSGTLPTDIAGITDQFKPGKVWTSFSQRRTGDYTDYNALKGYDNYVRGAMNVIYHTEDIQKLRALENEIRYQYSDKGVQEKIDSIYADDELTSEEKDNQIQKLVENVKNNPLGNFATELRNYTDNLANKKAFGDRSMEQQFGRSTYSLMQNINGRVSANMVGANISSALTNFIPITQAWSEVSTKNLLKGIKEATMNTFKNDGFDENSVYLTNRTQQADRLYKTGIDKVNQKLGIPFEAVDSFTSNAIVRAKYYDNIENGMSEIEAMTNADEFAKDVMAGRSKGDQPTIFNRTNPITKLFTAFQLEVNNQFGFMFKDIPIDLGDEAKEKLALAFVKMFLGAWLYNELSEKITGRRSAFDPINMAYEDYQLLTDEDKDISTKINEIAKGTAEELPFVGGLLGGGRLPIQGAIPYAGTSNANPLQDIEYSVDYMYNKIIGNEIEDEEKKQTAINRLKKEWSKPVYYLGLPFAGGQIKKTIEGLSMYDEDLPVAGSYTNSGDLRFTADTSTTGKIKSALFGQYANDEAQKYVESGYKTISKNDINKMKDYNMTSSEYRDYKSELKNYTTNEDKYNFIKSSDYSDELKEKMIANETNKNITNSLNYNSYAEFDYATKNPSKYKLSQLITNDFSQYEKIKDDISNIKGSNRKEQVIDYINNTNLSYIQKCILLKSYYSSVKDYNNDIYEYINGSDLSYDDKVSIFEELGFKVSNGRVSW